MHATFVVVEPKLTPSEYTVELPATVGRGREAKLKFTNGLLSRRHCELVEDDGGIVVRDLGSRNGTFIGGRRVESAPLGPGELLTVGGITLRAVYGETEDVMLAPEKVGETEAALAETIPMDDTITVQARAAAESDDWSEEESSMELEAEEFKAEELTAEEPKDDELNAEELNPEELEWLDEPETAAAPESSQPQASTEKEDDDFNRFLEGLR